MANTVTLVCYEVEIVDETTPNYTVTYPMEYVEHFDYIKKLLPPGGDSVTILFPIQPFMYEDVIRTYIKYRIDHPEKIEEFDRIAKEQTPTQPDWAEEFLSKYTIPQIMHMVEAAHKLLLEPLYRIIVKRIAREVLDTPLSEIDKKFECVKKIEVEMSKESEKEQE